VTYIGVLSTNIAAVGYERDTQTMAILFSNGGLYAYPDVPEDVYRGLITAHSTGQYFATHIKEQFKHSDKRMV
jgi:hypothetical protein